MTNDPNVNRVSPVTNAVVLMAGAGSRLRVHEKNLPKPLAPLLGRPLAAHLLETLAAAGIKKVHAVVGYESKLIMTELTPWAPPTIKLDFIYNRGWQKQNGISVLAAANQVGSPFLLTMCDHLFEPVIIQRLQTRIHPSQLHLAIDRKIDSVFDLDDAMKVATQGDLITAIGKNLPNYDAIDTGVFVCPAEIFDYLERSKRNEDCSLADGVALMAAAGKVRAVDIGDAWWQDVDTPGMFRVAEARLQELRAGRCSGGLRPSH